MDSVDRMERRKSLKERLGLKGMSCCGATWGFRPSTVSVRDEEEEGSPQPPQEEEQQLELIDASQTPAENTSYYGCVGQIPAASGMNLATALAAERHYRASQDSDDGGGEVSPVGPTNNGPSSVIAPGTLLRVSLMRLLTETDGVDGERETTGGQEGRGEVGSDSMCCVCMGRKKGAALITCGHTFCRVCSRELWLNRGTCPLCNRSILEILDIF